MRIEEYVRNLRHYEVQTLPEKVNSLGCSIEWGNGDYATYPIMQMEISDYSSTDWEEGVFPFINMARCNPSCVRAEVEESYKTILKGGVANWGLAGFRLMSYNCLDLLYAVYYPKRKAFTKMHFATIPLFGLNNVSVKFTVLASKDFSQETYIVSFDEGVRCTRIYEQYAHSRRHINIHWDNCLQREEGLGEAYTTEYLNI